MDIAKAVNDVKAGKIDFKVDKYGIIHAAVGKVSFEEDKLLENVNEILLTILKLKPSSSKGTYMKSVIISSTMSAGVQIEPKSIIT